MKTHKPGDKVIVNFKTVQKQATVNEYIREYDQNYYRLLMDGFPEHWLWHEQYIKGVIE